MIGSLRSGEPASGVLGMVGAAHGKIVANRRTRVLVRNLATLIPNGARVLDIGCGDGSVARLLANQVAGASVEGIDVLVRPHAHITVHHFDGVTVPYPSDRFDVALLVDVIHHANNPLHLLKEATRIAKMVLIKDHIRRGLFAGATLRFMDWVGNAPHGVALRYDYWSKPEWDSALNEAGLAIAQMYTRLRLYPIPASWFFDRHLHFIARCERN